MSDQTIKALSFELRGKFAHFRKFYTNSSSLTYPIPPPTTLIGTIGATMGLDRNEFSEVLDGIRLSIRPLTPWRTILQSINLLKITSSSEVTGSNKDKHTQVPTQLLVPLDLDKNLGYEVFVVHQDEDLLKKG